MATIDTVSFDAAMRDLFPLPGTRLKQWVVDTRAREAWKVATCPTVGIEAHIDNTGIECRNDGRVLWFKLDHDSCSVCCDELAAMANRLDIRAWCDELAKRPPICEDQSKLSDEVQPEYPPMRRFW